MRRVCCSHHAMHPQKALKAARYRLIFAALVAPAKEERAGWVPSVGGISSARCYFVRSAFGAFRQTVAECLRLSLELHALFPYFAEHFE